MEFPLHHVALVFPCRVGKAMAEPSRLPSPFTYSFHVAALAKLWLNLCDEHHSIPQPLSSALTGQIVLEVLSGLDLQRPRPGPGPARDQRIPGQCTTRNMTEVPIKFEPTSESPLPVSSSCPKSEMIGALGCAERYSCLSAVPACPAFDR